MPTRSIICLIAVIVFLACSLVAEEEQADSPAKNSLDTAKAEINKHWALRDRQEECRKAIALLKETLVANPSWEEGWSWLSWAHYWEGNNWPEGDKRKKLCYEKGMDAGQKAIALNTDSVGGQFWYIVNKSSYGRERGIVRSAVYLPEILEVSEKVEKLDASYFSGGVYRLYARIIFKTPKFLRKAKGYEINDAVKELQNALKVDNNFSLTHLYLADVYLEMDKREEAKAELQFVLNLPEEIVPGMEAEVRRDKKTARKRMAEHFN